MQFEIKSERGHYILNVNGKFYGSYDSFSEAVNDIELIRAGKEEA